MNTKDNDILKMSHAQYNNIVDQSVIALQTKRVGFFSLRRSVRFVFEMLGTLLRLASDNTFSNKLLGDSQEKVLEVLKQQNILIADLMERVAKLEK